ncbi:small subunit ribosomal protein S15e [Nematocida sp. AWRm77]|nr:small subunit ribosomal protein S15e [Nematocida sp. AWRm77]
MQTKEHTEANTAAMQDAKKKGFRRFTYRGIDVEELMEMPIEEFANLLDSKSRRRIRRGFSEEEKNFLLECEHSKIAARKTNEKPACVTTSCRRMIIFPQLVGCTVGVHNGKEFITFEIRPDMVGYRLADFSSPRKTTSHGKPGIGATSSSKFVPLK